MLEFRPVRLDDQDFAKTVICSSGCHGADYSFANLYIWKHAYEPEIAFRGNRMVIRMRGLTPKTLEEFEPLYGDQFTIEENREDADYIYTVEKLRDLRGRKLSSKRNHIKHFERNGDWEFKLIEVGADIDVARAFVAEFYRADV